MINIRDKKQLLLYKIMGYKPDLKLCYMNDIDLSYVADPIGKMINEDQTFTIGDLRGWVLIDERGIRFLGYSWNYIRNNFDIIIDLGVDYV